MANLALEKGHEIVAFNRSPEPTKKLQKQGATAVFTLEDVVKNLKSPRVLWIMVPHQAVDDVLNQLLPLLSRGDTVIDGGNSRYDRSKQRADLLANHGVHFLDVGVSGGPDGARNGACMMIGGRKDVFENVEPLIKDLCVEDGYGYMGTPGAGHFVKMVHNGIEYGMMQSIAEGFHILKDNNEFKLDLHDVARVYNRGSVIESRLIGWLKKAYEEHGAELDGITGSASASGEGLWTTEVAHKLGVSDAVIHDAVKAREKSQRMPNYGAKIVSALRNQFGGHDVSDNRPKKP